MVRNTLTLKELRAFLGLTQSELASKVDLPQARISEFENKSPNLTTQSLGRLSQAVGYPAIIQVVEDVVEVKFLVPEAHGADQSKLVDEMLTQKLKS